MDKQYKDLLFLVGLILAFIIARYFWKKTPRLGGSSFSNNERWELIRDNNGVIKEIIVHRDVKS